MNIIENKSFDEERAMYGSRDLIVKNCIFDGPADGESAFKECANISASNCLFNLRYPFWHSRHLKIDSSEMTVGCRAALWYSDDIKIKNCLLDGIKALRECCNARLENCQINSPEFGWSVRNIIMENCKAQSEYFMLRAENIRFNNVEFSGKYSFQYIKNSVFENCTFNTKDAFWHSENVVVRNSIVKGEYLGWYSNGLTLENCKIIGTQPLCYCKNLRLNNCEMIDADLCFEKSEVNATVTNKVVSIKNPIAGHIEVFDVDELILDINTKCKIITLSIT